MRDLFDEQHLKYHYEELGQMGPVSLYARTLVGYPASGNYFRSLRDKIPPLSATQISERPLARIGVKFRHVDGVRYPVGSNELWNPLNSLEQAMQVAMAFQMELIWATRGRIAVRAGDRIAIASYIDFNDTNYLCNQRDVVVWGKAYCHVVVGLAAFLSATSSRGEK